MGLLTDFFTDVAIGVGSNYLGGQQPNQIWAGSTQMGYAPGGGFIMPTGNGYQTGGGIPGYDLIPEPGNGSACGPCGSPVFKKVCGGYKWVYPKRKRRKQLLTRSDARGLAALKGILGNGKSMETWIATHGS